ncbi:MAG: acyltransferase [Chloroflexi bacterium]|nr:acyltransferase [Chloroflexota bacterium]
MKIHFKGLNALRFYAAISVVIHHIMYNPRQWYGIPDLPDTIGRLFLNGTDAVHLFFVLSGFLITYLMLVERERTSTVSVKKFYMRRVLRIWPLYYALLLVTALLLPPITSAFNNTIANPVIAILLILFQGNIAFIIYYPFPPLEHLWSIAIEEQFYLFIPHVGKSDANLAKFFLAVIVFWWSLMAFMFWQRPDDFFTIVIRYMRYDCIAIGGLFACAYYFKHPILKLIYHPVVSGLAVLVTVAVAILVHEAPHIPYTVVTTFAFAILILNVATNERFPLKLDHPWLEEAGNLSYGIYMLHTLVLLVFLHFTHEQMSEPLYQFAIYPIIIVATVALSWLSYRYFESPFLRLKDTFKVAR